ncbi:hypothetical protein BDR07DRAFT_1386012 [Suillus spraguei]|nr:hypothetical protein BDR07DRAFT_1386012 [Suillus spraguei]
MALLWLHLVCVISLEGFCKRYIMVPNGTGPRWDYVRDISWYQMALDLDGTIYIMVPNGTGPRWDYVKDISWYQMELDLNGTMRACIGPYIYALQFPIYEAISMVYGHSSTPL